MHSISEEFKDQKINQMLEDYIALDKEIKNIFESIKQAIEETPSRFDNLISQKIDQLIKSGQEIDKEVAEIYAGIKEEKEKTILEIKETTLNIKEKFTSDIFDLLSSLKSNIEKSQEIQKQQLLEVSKKTKPFNMKMAILACSLCTIFVTSGLSYSFWYASNIEKQNDLIFYANGYTDMQSIVEKSIKLLPPKYQTELKKDLEAINNRTK